MTITEEMITEMICQFLELLQKGQLNRIAPSGFFKNGAMRKHKSKFIKKGVSDIQFMYQGKFYVFEVKTPKEYKFVMKNIAEISRTPRVLLYEKKAHLKDQFDYITGIRNNGGIGDFVCSVDQVKNLIFPKKC